MPLDRVREFGPVQREDVSPYLDDTHPTGVGATSHLIQFDDVVVRGVDFPGENFFLTQVAVSTPSYPLACGLRIGLSVTTLSKCLPDALAERSDGTVTYHGESESVTFDVRDGRIDKVELNFYTG